MMFRTAIFACLLLPAAGVSAMSGASIETPHLRLTPATFSALDGWPSGNLHAATRAFYRSCPKHKPVGLASAAAWRAACRAAAAHLSRKNTLSEHDWRRFWERHFRPYRIRTTSGATEGLVTGYYEPLIRASRTRGPEYTVPLYAKPAALPSPAPTRAQIDNGALAGRGLEIAWAADPIEVFFLHIQGSGRLQFPDGSTAKAGFAGRNGHPYHSIGRVLINQGEIAAEAMSAPAIKRWLKAHPQRMTAVMQRNPSYIFFRLQEDDRIPPSGSLGVPLTPRASIAVDWAHYPPGAPVWIESSIPHPHKSARAYAALHIAQDTGSAIRGPLRADIFWGAGREAERIAGHLKSPGRFTLLLPREPGAR